MSNNSESGAGCGCMWISFTIGLLFLYFILGGGDIDLGEKRFDKIYMFFLVIVAVVIIVAIMISNNKKN